MSQTPPPLSPPVVPAAPPISPQFKLYDTGPVALATFLGSPLAGGVLMAMNYRRLGRPGAGWMTILGAIAVTMALIVLASFLPDQLGYGMGIGALVGTLAVMRALQGDAIEAHKSAGGPVGSMWVGAGVGLLCGVLVLASILGYVMLTPVIPGERHVVGKDEIFYSGTATAADAQALGTALVKAEFFEDTGVTVQLIKGESTVLGFVVQDGAWDKSEVKTYYVGLVREVANSIGGLPVELRFLNEMGETKSSSVIN